MRTRQLLNCITLHYYIWSSYNDFQLGYYRFQIGKFLGIMGTVFPGIFNPRARILSMRANADDALSIIPIND